MDFSLVYSTASSTAEARNIGLALVEARLAACVNIIDGMKSIYRWKRKVEEGSETVLIAKTKATLVPEVVAKIRSLHSYECPAVVAVPITAGSPEYLAWIGQETE